MKIVISICMSIFGSVSAFADSVQTPYEIVHFRSGNATLGGELFKPKGKGPFPAVLYNHGSVEGMKSDAASTAMGPLYNAKGWIYFMPYRRGQGLSEKGRSLRSRSNQ